MRRFIFLFFVFPMFVVGLRLIPEPFVPNQNVSAILMYSGAFIWGVFLVIYFARLPQKPNKPS